ncbi:GrpB family protein [Bernardetia sp.]|uniref:GrpB family protein n=1 Tax=Bernardetia sp. TaxID=1937974 RepID=UPI0025BF2FB2|nr:GrpB family protein [Bernardetia sp.]
MLIQKYNPNWIFDFEKIKQKLETVLPKNTKVEHIGSTAVPNLAAKDIIDIDIVYFDEADTTFQKVKEDLVKRGYYHNGNQGIEDREVFKREKENADEILDKISHHLYVCPSDSEELKRHLLFRNFLRENEKARQEYESIKFDIALRTNQMKKEYAELKEKEAKDFIEKTIQKAREQTV